MDTNTNFRRSFTTTTAKYDEKGFTRCPECSTRSTAIMVHRNDARNHQQMHVRTT